jgi:predicted enzyme related to lactoylglutathione lyase
MPNPVVQFQVITQDPAAHSNFYAEVFGWTISADNSLGYRTADTGSERGIGGGFWPAPPGVPAFLQAFIEVEDIAATVKRVEAAGGGVLVPPQKLPDGDQMAILRDPQGLSFGVMVPAKK